MNLSQLLDKKNIEMGPILAKSLSDHVVLEKVYSGVNKWVQGRCSDMPDITKSGSVLVMEMTIEKGFSGIGYFVLSNGEYELLCEKALGEKVLSLEKKEAFVKQLVLDLLESVMTSVAKKLNFKIRLQNPVVSRSFNFNAGEKLVEDFSMRTEQIYVNAVSFLLQEVSGFTPLLIWALDMEVIPMTSNREMVLFHFE